MTMRDGPSPPPPPTWKFREIGRLESCYKDKFGVPRQAGLVPEATAKLKIHAEFQPELTLQGLAGFSHLWLVTVFHQNRTARFHAKVHPPRWRGESLGVFATRSPHRPNPIALSLVKLNRIADDTLFLEGVDLMEGTPVLDIKPYLPSYESKPEARSGWFESADQGVLDVSFTEETDQAVAEWQERLGSDIRLREIITGTIRLDPRPLLYREEEEGEARRDEHAFRLYDGDVHFRLTGENRAEVFKILQLHDGFRPTSWTSRRPLDKSMSPKSREESDGNDGDRDQDR